jgi:hypothetical protein
MSSLVQKEGVSILSVNASITRGRKIAAAKECSLLETCKPKGVPIYETSQKKTDRRMQCAFVSGSSLSGSLHRSCLAVKRILKFSYDSNYVLKCRGIAKKHLIFHGGVIG